MCHFPNIYLVGLLFKIERRINQLHVKSEIKFQFYHLSGNKKLAMDVNLKYKSKERTDNYSATEPNKFL